jgi:hypothetical protein
MPVIEKMRIAATAVIKNALGIIIIIVLVFRDLKKRVALSGKKTCRAYLQSSSKSFLST